MIGRKRLSLKVFFVAPLQSADRDAPTFLAAHRKIFFLLDLLHAEGFEVVFINSGPAMTERRKAKQSTLLINSTTEIPCFNPSTIAHTTKLGRLLNVNEAPQILDMAVAPYGIPSLMWCYNGYAFEMHVAKCEYDRYSVKTILGFEDWHFARSSWLNPKATLDWLLWRRAVPNLGFAFVVNHFLKRKMKHYAVPVELLPGAIADGVLKLAVSHPPFSDRGSGQLR